jgi:hypothetical protein
VDVAPDQELHPIPANAGYCSGAQTLFGHSSISKARRTVSPSGRNSVSIHLSFLTSRSRRFCGARCSSLVKVSSSNLAFMTVDCSHAVRVHKLPSYSSTHSLDYAHTESLNCLSSRIYYGQGYSHTEALACYCTSPTLFVDTLFMYMRLVQSAHPPQQSTCKIPSTRLCRAQWLHSWYCEGDHS